MVSAADCPIPLTVITMLALGGASGRHWSAALNRLTITGFDGLDRLLECCLQHIPADGPEYEAQRVALQVLSFADHDGIDIGLSVGAPRECVDVAGVAAPRVGVCGLHHHAVAIGPVVVEPLPHATGTLRDVCVSGAAVMDLEVIVRAVAEDLRPAGTKVDERGEELLWRRGGGLMEMKRSHVYSLTARPSVVAVTHITARCGAPTAISAAF